VEREIVAMAKALNLGVVAWAPLAGGVLSGKYHSGESSGGRYQNQTREAIPVIPGGAARATAPE
jgi:aryl-alcohol dehydrogenase-like predicted oxidoreductase